MGKIRVLQFPFSSNNGVTVYATKNWEYIDKTKFDFDFVVVRKHFDPVWEKNQLQSGAGVKELFYSADRQPELYVKRLREILNDGYDVVHLHTSFWKRLTVEQIAVECKIPKIIVHSHNTGVDSLRGHDQTAYDRHCQLRQQFGPHLATDFCACSQAAADWLFGEQIPREQVQILKNAIEVEKYIFNEHIRNKYRQKMGLDGCFVIGCVGRFSYQKNHEFLIDVFQKVTYKRPNVRLLLVGEGPLEGELREQAKQLGIEDKVIFVGQRSDVPQLLQAMDLFCLPSQFEGLPIVLIEAQTAGLKCLVSDFITDEVCITSSIARLALKRTVWVDRILDISQNYTRNNAFDDVTNAGYNLKLQIHAIENLYSLS